MQSDAQQQNCEQTYNHLSDCLGRLDHLIELAIIRFMLIEFDVRDPRNALTTVTTLTKERYAELRARILDYLLPLLGIDKSVQQLINDYQLLLKVREQPEFNQLTTSEKRKYYLELARTRKRIEQSISKLCKLCLDDYFVSFDNLIEYCLTKIDIYLLGQLKQLFSQMVEDRKWIRKMLEKEK